MSIESMVKALHTPDLSPSEKLLLVGIANHDGDGGAWPKIATLALYVGVKERQVQKLLSALEERGLVTRDLNGGGNARTRDDQRPNLFHLHFDGVSSSAPRGVSPRTPETPSEPSDTSSLRSDGDVREESGSDDDARGAALPAPKDAGQRVARAYWDAFVAANDGLRPSTPFLQLAAVARKALKSGAYEHDVMLGMLATRVMTGEAVVREVARIRRERENRPATGAISQTAVELVDAWFDWHDERCDADADRVHFHGKLATLQALTTMIGWPSMSTAEVGARFGGFARAHGSNRLPNLDDLKAVPLGSHPLRPDDLNAVQTFERYANGPRLTA